MSKKSVKNFLKKFFVQVVGQSFLFCFVFCVFMNGKSVSYSLQVDNKQSDEKHDDGEKNKKTKTKTNKNLIRDKQKKKKKKT
jgi:hypothetical protein